MIPEFYRQTKTNGNIIPIKSHKIKSKQNPQNQKQETRRGARERKGSPPEPIEQGIPQTHLEKTELWRNEAVESVTCSDENAEEAKQLEKQKGTNSFAEGKESILRKLLSVRFQVHFFFVVTSNIYCPPELHKRQTVGVKLKGLEPTVRSCVFPRDSYFLTITIIMKNKKCIKK
jgi:hypothetical protein